MVEYRTLTPEDLRGGDYNVEECFEISMAGLISICVHDMSSLFMDGDGKWLECTSSIEYGMQRARGVFIEAAKYLAGLWVSIDIHAAQSNPGLLAVVW